MTPRIEGYSLMEAMVALFILAIATVGLTRATQTHIDGVRGLEQRVVGQWVAENRLVEMNLQGGAAPGPVSVRMMDRDWMVETQVRPTDDPDLLAVELSVAEAGAPAATARLSGFVDRLAGGAA